MSVVYSIRPYADPTNFGVDLKMDSPDGLYAASISRAVIPRDVVPTLIRSKRTKELPDAFVPSDGYWCVSTRVREFLWNLFGDQLLFYEVPVVSEPLRAPLNSTYFVAFTNFRTSIDWGLSKPIRETELILDQTIVSYSVGVRLQCLVFHRQLHSEKIIWREKSTRKGNEIFIAPEAVFATSASVELIDAAFPNLFDLEQLTES